MATTVIETPKVYVEVEPRIISVRRPIFSYELYSEIKRIWVKEPGMASLSFPFRHEFGSIESPPVKTFSLFDVTQQNSFILQNGWSIRGEAVLDGVVKTTWSLKTGIDPAG